MNTHVRAVSCLWTIVGVALAFWAIWGLTTEEHSKSVVESWLIVLGFAILACVGGLTFGRTRVIGRIVIWLVSALTLLYSAAWLFLGGVDAASGYAPAIFFAVTLSFYTFYASKRTARATYMSVNAAPLQRRCASLSRSGYFSR